VSVAGVKLDMTKAQALGKWGHGKCDSQLCIWEGKGPVGHREVATISFYKDKVDSISIRSATKGNNGQFKPGILSDWETKKGIHLGSPKANVPRAYPAAKANTSTGVNGFDLFKGHRPNLSYTRFGTAKQRAKLKRRAPTRPRTEDALGPRAARWKHGGSGSPQQLAVTGWLGHAVSRVR
jgi:hypothetical protein